MDAFIVEGQRKLRGTIVVSSAKNSVLKLIAACLLYPGAVKLVALPRLRDVFTMLELIKSMGVKVQLSSESQDQPLDVTIDATEILHPVASYDLVKTMRASILVLGPLLARLGKAKVSLPGGCAIGARPIDLHLTGLKKMGARIRLQNGYVYGKSSSLVGSQIVLAFPSVGATENLMMAAVLADGETHIENAAKEPELEDLAAFLMKLFPVKISGVGSSEIHIQPKTKRTVKKSKRIIQFQAQGDRVEAATYVIAAAALNANLEVNGFCPQHLTSVLESLKSMGVPIKILKNGVKVQKRKQQLTPIHLDTAPYPGFPTDVQAQIMTLMSLASGASMVTEHIFENRFMHVPELVRMGANITIRGSSAIIKGIQQFTPAQVMCTDLRASAALLIAAMTASGKTIIRRVYHIDRGYERIDVKLNKVGAKITRIHQSSISEGDDYESK